MTLKPSWLLTFSKTPEKADEAQITYLRENISFNRLCELLDYLHDIRSHLQDIKLTVRGQLDVTAVGDCLVTEHSLCIVKADTSLGSNTAKQNMPTIHTPLPRRSRRAHDSGGI